jgi:protein-S-isoprenylcysteine O-methyltransferase Ste14
MNLKIGSFLAFAIVVLGMLFLLEKHFVFSKNPITIIIQVCSFALMIWARLTFGFRSFHATANTTEGKLVTSGPYHWFRHPIYAAIFYFFWASVISYPFIETIVTVIIVTIALFVRMLSEEKFLIKTYDEYTEYSKRTKRIIPFLF